MKKVTIKDVAKESGVSISTVSQILNGKEASFSPKTVKKVLEVKQQLNYQPDYFAQRMIMKKSKTIGVLVPDISDPFFAFLVKGIEDVLYRQNFMTMLCHTAHSYSNEVDPLVELSRRGVDGYIIASPDIATDVLVDTMTTPFIVLDQKKHEGNSDAIMTDDYEGGSLAASHLQQLNHKKVAVLLPDNPPTNIQQRYEGFVDCFGSSNIVRISSELTKEGGQKGVPVILASDVTGIFAINDEIAFGVYLGMMKRNKKIPADYSVIGYDNIDMCEIVTPQLTTIAQPTFELGQRTAEVLLHRIQEPERAKVIETLPVHLVIRDSTAYA